MTVALLAIASCVRSPSANSVVPAGTDTLTFSGTYLYDPARPATIQMEVRDGSTWVPLGSPIAVAENGRWTSPPLTIAARYWTGPCEAAVFRAVSSLGGLVLMGSDEACLAAAGAGATPEELIACSRQQLVVRRRDPGVTYAPTSELLIASQEAADVYACVSVLDGDLRVEGGGGLRSATHARKGVTLSLPTLQEVTGTLQVFGQRAERISLPSLREVGTADSGPRGMTLVVNKFIVGDLPADIRTSMIDAPALTRVGGALTLQTANMDAARVDTSYEFGLPALVNVQAIRAQHAVAGRQGYMKGLPAVDTVNGDLTIRSESFEIWHDRLLPAVTRIVGNLNIEAASHVQKLLLSLDEVTETVRIEGIESVGGGAGNCQLAFSGGQLMPNLRSIGGDLVNQGCRFSTNASGFPNLASVGGTFRILGAASGGNVRLGKCDAPPLSLGSLQISNSNLSQIPLATNVAVSSTGSVTITDNSALCQCHVDAFTEALSWAGTPTSARNAACDSSCPSLLVCP